MEVKQLPMDREWFSEQIRDREAAMYALAMSYMKHEDDALDCMQQSILKAYEHLGSLRDPEKFRPWIYGILINCCKDELRRKKRAGVSEEQAEDRPAPEAPVSTETKQVLWNAVDRLSEPYRTVLILFYYLSFSPSDKRRSKISAWFVAAMIFGVDAFVLWLGRFIPLYCAAFTGVEDESEESNELETIPHEHTT